jgi:hypothetical protein
VKARLADAEPPASLWKERRLSLKDTSAFP